MRTLAVLEKSLSNLADSEHFLFSENDFLSIFPGLTVQNLRMAISRAVKNGILERVCKGIYLYSKSGFDSSIVLFKVASKLRADFFNYVSFETVLSQAGLISQMPLGWISVMTTGRRGIINCGRFGSVEFIHTQKNLEKIMPSLHLDTETGMFWASEELALQDMKDAKRPLDLVQKEQNNDSI